VSKISPYRVISLGCLIGIAAGVKYVAVLLLPVGAICLIFRMLKTESHLRTVTGYCLLLGLASVIGFLISTPLSVLQYHKFLSDVAFLSAKVPVWNGTYQMPIGFVGIPRQIWILNNPLILLAATIGMYYYVRNPNKIASILIPGSALIYFIFMGRSYFFPLRFDLYLFIMLLFVAGFGIEILMQKFAAHNFRKVIVVFVAVAITWQVGVSLILAYNFHMETRYLAAKWLNVNTKAARKIAFSHRVPAYFFPPQFLNKQTIDTDQYTPDNVDSLLHNPQVEFIVTSSFWNAYKKPGDMAMLRKLTVENGWQVVQLFKNRGGLRNWDERTEFLCPEIKIYGRIASRSAAL